MPSPEFLARSVRQAVTSLTNEYPSVSPEFVGATAAGVAAALAAGADVAASSGSPPAAAALPQGVRFVTGPANTRFPDPDAPGPLHVFPGVIPGGPHPTAPGPGDPFPAVVNPAVVNPAVFGPMVDDPPTPVEPGPYPPGFPQPIEPGPYPPGMPQPIDPPPAPGSYPAVVNPAVVNPAVVNPAVVNPAAVNPATVNPAVFGPSVVQTPTPVEPGPYPPGSPQPIEPGPYPGGPQPISPGGLPWTVDPTFGVLVFEQFLDETTTARIRELVQSERDRFQPSVVMNEGMVSVDAARRAALTLSESPTWLVQLFTARLDGVLEFACSRFGVTPKLNARVWDVHVTATPPGGGFVPHIDNGMAPISDRVLSWVYYVSSDGVAGGDLTLYDAREPRALLESLTRRATVPPTPNSLVVFPSWLVHEIAPVLSAAGDRTDGLGRVTVHGWLRWPRD